VALEVRKDSTRTIRCKVPSKQANSNRRRDRCWAVRGVVDAVGKEGFAQAGTIISHSDPISETQGSSTSRYGGVVLVCRSRALIAHAVGFPVVAAES
jgi:hypothetical protein